MLRTGWTYDELMECPVLELDALIEWVVKEERVKAQQK